MSFAAELARVESSPDLLASSCNGGGGLERLIVEL